MSYTTIIGITLFVLIYIFSAALYPGGSQADLTSEGFDWVHNYWCNLLNTEAMNGRPNPARPYAITATIVLCGSIAIFFYQFSGALELTARWRQTIRISGLSSMVCAALIFTRWHDLMTTLASMFGLVALAGVIIVLISNKMHAFLRWAALCILLMGVNNYIYYSGYYLVALPLLQKITFLVVLGWVVALSISLRQNEKQTEGFIVKNYED